MAELKMHIILDSLPFLASKSVFMQKYRFSAGLGITYNRLSGSKNIFLSAPKKSCSSSLQFKMGYIESILLQ